MNKTLIPCLALTVLLQGCFVKSLSPWLSDDCKVTDIDLTGQWHDAGQGLTMSFAEGEEKDQYQILFLSPDNECARVEGALYKLDKTFYLMIQPPECTSFFEMCVNQPCYSLFKAEINDKEMILYYIATEVIKQLAETKKIKICEFSKDEPPLIISSTEELTKLLKDNLKEDNLFMAEPLYTFKSTSLLGASEADIFK
ncbi:MAG: hypothetical protein GX811_01055 [Lentisphaerae bacterium]|nr:hypothetical protein [Lentisphaerota bacterium]